MERKLWFPKMPQVKLLFRILQIIGG